MMHDSFVNLLQSAEKEFDDRKVDLRLSKALCESTDGQNDRRPVKRRFSPYPATGFPREDIPVCVDTHGPTCVIQ